MNIFVRKFLKPKKLKNIFNNSYALQTQLSIPFINVKVHCKIYMLRSVVWSSFFFFFCILFFPLLRPCLPSLHCGFLPQALICSPKSLSCHLSNNNRTTNNSNNNSTFRNFFARRTARNKIIIIEGNKKRLNKDNESNHQATSLELFFLFYFVAI